MEQPFARMDFGRCHCFALPSGTFAMALTHEALIALRTDQRLDRDDLKALEAARHLRVTKCDAPVSTEKPIVLSQTTGQILSLAVLLASQHKTAARGEWSTMTAARAGLHVHFTPQREMMIALYGGRDQMGIVTHLAGNRHTARAALDAFERARDVRMTPMQHVARLIDASPLPERGQDDACIALRGQEGVTLLYLAMLGQRLASSQ